MEKLLKIYDFVVLCVAILAAIGGTAYLFYDKHYVFGAANICLVALAVPYIITRVKHIMQ